ncbi:MAG: GNAT family N-acetyltransferase [Pleurocapsa minor GSE-CHR-MK-17-07R]|jgi:ADP-ribose pyrophosphatase YjhB (NUDIX family)/ribosomal protein S18 acetylase RimI-like enzyme|nr:GNAT family N-acetyltransferase [Pleurocapsa minor GSE-CHR-MK 17-07R]
MAKLIYCPVCGHTLGERVEGGRLRKACDNCGYIHFVNPVPAVGIVIEADDGLVLIRRNHPPHKGQWALPSGFVEEDEGAEDAAIREAKEETGLDVELVELFGVNSFPEGPPLSGIMIFYRARVLGGEVKGGDDALEAKVFPRDALPLLPFRTHREAVAQWLAGHQPAGVVSSERNDDEGKDFYIRPAELNDAQEITALLALIPANRGLTRDDYRETILRLRESVGLDVYVAVARQNPPLVVGFIAMSVVRSLTEGRGIINDMAVLPTYQRRGIGAALLEAAMRRAERLGLNTLMVNVERANDRARAFYESLGFSSESFLRLKIR